jgi:hypothetical protein
MTTIIEAWNELNAAEDRYYDAIKSTFPVGSHVGFYKSHNVYVAGEVLAHSGDRIRLRNLQTGATYWKDWNKHFRQLPK